MKDGLVEKFWDNGQLLERGNYKDGKKDGLWERYNEDGRLYKKENYKDGRLIKKT